MKTSMSNLTLRRAVQSGSVLRRSNSIKPFLTDSNKLDRMKFAMDHIDYNSCKNIYESKNTYDYVHVDKNWFRIMKYHQSFYLEPDELKPHRSAEKKNFIEKIMFLRTIVRPRYNPETRSYFDGKIGIWQFVVFEAAQRSLRNKPAGILKMKAIEVTREILLTVKSVSCNSFQVSGLLKSTNLSSAR